jgi:hypothetical protein
LAKGANAFKHTTNPGLSSHNGVEETPPSPRSGGGGNTASADSEALRGVSSFKEKAAQRIKSREPVIMMYD